MKTFEQFIIGEEIIICRSLEQYEIDYYRRAWEDCLKAQKESVAEVPCSDGLCKLPAEAIAVEDDWQLAQDHVGDKNWQEAYDAMRLLQDKISELNGILLAKIIA